MNITESTSNFVTLPLKTLHQLPSDLRRKFKAPRMSSKLLQKKDLLTFPNLPTPHPCSWTATSNSPRICKSSNLEPSPLRFSWLVPIHNQASTERTTPGGSPASPKTWQSRQSSCKLFPVLSTYIPRISLDLNRMVVCLCCWPVLFNLHKNQGGKLYCAISQIKKLRLRE